MQMIKRNTGSPGGLVPLHGLLDDAFWDPFGIWHSPLIGRRFLPAMNIAETARDLTIGVNIPGFDTKDISVDVHDNILTIAGKAAEEAEEKEKQWVCRECSSGEFLRQVRLPDYVDGSQAVCKVKNGVLTITIPKREQAAKKTLKIEEE